MPALRPDIDPDGLLEYSVVFTDRSLNHMSQAFQHVMREIHATLCEVYGAHRAVVGPRRRGRTRWNRSRASSSPARRRW
jgi:hypothetical protein